MIEDVETDAPHTPMRRIARAAGYRAVQSTPLIGRDGAPLGMISTYWASVHRPSEQDLRRLDLYARQAADFIERCKIDEALRRNERELADFFENATIGLHWVGPDGVILRVNQAELDMLGYRRDEYVGRHIADFHADRQVNDDILERLTRGEKVHEYPARLRCKDGSIRDVMIDSSGLFENGRFIHTRCFTLDVTERKRAEQALRESRERYELVVAGAQAAIWDWDVPGKRVNYSPRWKELHGLSGVEVSDSEEEWRRGIHPDDFERVMAAVEAHFAGETPVFTEEYRLRHKDGSWLWVLDRGVAARDASGRVVRMAGSETDITERKLAEEALRRSEERYRQTLALTPVAVYTCDASGVITYFNQQAARLWGRSPRLGDTDERFCGSEQMILPDGTPLPHEQCPMAVALREGRAFHNTEVNIHRPDGSTVTVLVNIDPIRDERGAILGAINAFLDISAIKRAEDALQENERRFRDMIDALPAAVYTTDAEGRITHFNQAAVAFSGRVPALGTDSWCVTWKLYYPDGSPMSHDECPMAVTLKEGREIRGAEAIAERPDGTRIWFTPYPKLLYDNEGRVAGAVNMLVDITERKRAEQVLRESEERFRILSDSAPALIWVNGVDGCEYVNRGYLDFLGVTIDELRGYDWTQFVHPDDREDYLKTYSKAEDERRLFDADFRFRRHDGEYRWMRSVGQPRLSSGGDLMGYCGVTLDITEQKNAEATQSLLLNELNHRVKNTLASVQAIAQQTLARTRDPADFVASFGGRIQSLARVHSMLSAATWHGADLRELIRDQLLSGPVDETRLTAWGPTVRLDPQTALHLAMILHELGTNACKYGSLSVPIGSVTVHWTADDALHLQWVERGGPPVVMPSRRGFGLTLIEKSAESQGGDAKMRGEAEGITWTIRLPLKEPVSTRIRSQIEQPPRSQTHTGDAEPRTRLAGRRILVVEDEPLIGLDIVAGLEQAEALVVGPVGTPEQAIDIIERTALDGALLDANLHGRPVDEVASALTRRNIPFVFLTGHARDSLPRAFRKVAIISKPVSRQQVLDAAAQLVAKRGEVVRLRG